MVFTVCRYRPVIPEYGEAADKCDPGSLELCFDVGTEICDYGVFPCPYLQEIRLGNAGTDSEIGSAAHFFQDFRTAAGVSPCKVRRVPDSSGRECPAGVC